MKAETKPRPVLSVDHLIQISEPRQPQPDRDGLRMEALPPGWYALTDAQRAAVPVVSEILVIAQTSPDDPARRRAQTWRTGLPPSSWGRVGVEGCGKRWHGIQV